MPFLFNRVGIPDLILLQAKSFSDKRGFFLEHFKESEFFKNGIRTKFVQDNFSYSYKGVLRGLHYQIIPKAQAKLVIVLGGEIFDVAVDLRKKSPSYGKWFGDILSDKNHKMLFIPEGFAHGFCVLSEFAQVLYKVNQEYSPEHERGIIWNDPTLNIEWPTEKPILTEKDFQLPLLKDAENNFL